MTKRKQATKPDPMEHARSNAEGHFASIGELVAALAFFNGDDADRFDDLEGERDAIDTDDKTALKAWDKENGEELAELRAAKGEYESREDVEQRIQEYPLSVEVRSDWHEVGGDNTPGEFRILLTTGGPALQILGELDEHGTPTRAYMQMQDWGTSWTDFFPGSGSGEVLLTFAQQFYFGE
jgi:hypothetical protein